MDSNGSAAPRKRAPRTPARAETQPAAAPAGITAEPASVTMDPTVVTNAATIPAEPDLTGGPGAAGEVAPEPAAEVHTREGISIPEATLASLGLHRGAIGRLDAQEVEVHFGAIGAARADEIEIELGTIGAALANELEVSQGAVGTVLTSEARLDQAVVRTMIARTVVVERPSLIGFLLARRVSGDVRVLFDWRGAVVFGVLFGLIARVGRRGR